MTTTFVPPNKKS